MKNTNKPQNSIQKTIMFQPDNLNAIEAFGKQIGSRSLSDTVNQLLYQAFENIITIKKHNETLLSALKEQDIKRQNDLERVIGILINNRKIEEETFKTVFSIGNVMREDIMQNKRLASLDTQDLSLEEQRNIQKTSKNIKDIHEKAVKISEEKISTFLTTKKSEDEGKRV